MLKLFCEFLRLFLSQNLRNATNFQYAKIYERMENVDIDSFYRICLLAAIITMKLLILKILYGEESLRSIFHFLCKVIVSGYYSVYLPFLLSKKILSCSLFFRFLFYLILPLFYFVLPFILVLYLLSIFLASNMRGFGSVSDVNVSYIVNNDFNDCR